MKYTKIESTRYTPEIILDPSGLVSISGKSYPENTFEFYAPILRWVKDYLSKDSVPKTVVNLEIIYFNSSSSKLFFDLLDLFDESKNVCDSEVNWIYDEENENAKEAGEDFIDDFDSLRINLVLKNK